MMRLTLDGVSETQYWGGASVATIMGTRNIRASSSTVFEDNMEQFKELTELIGSVPLVQGSLKGKARVGTGVLPLARGANRWRV
jgi:hypothetical protein